VHRILLDYITFLSPSEVKDMAQTLRDHVVHILHTKEGAQIGAWCVTYGSPKDRKAVIKVPHSLTLCRAPFRSAARRLVNRTNISVCGTFGSFSRSNRSL
jgi:hypothetical protein